MAPLLLPQRAARVALAAVRARGDLAPGGGACGARPPPPCPPCAPAPPPPCQPCAPAPPPPCRARAPAVRHAQRVVCCAPPPSQRPPCAPAVAAPPLTCRDALRQNREPSNRTSHRDTLNISECDRDPVAVRLKLAKCVQQAEYELEVAKRAQRVAPRPPRVTYRLRGERECARATDGCTYVVLAPAAAAPPARCGPDRTPPPPRCVELAPDDACRIRDDARLDPCAHRPPTMLEIDRSTSVTPVAPRPAPRAPIGPCAPVAPRAPTAKRGGAPTPSLCANLPPPVAAPPRCRPPTIVERLRSRPTESPSERRIHTSTTMYEMEMCGKAATGGLEGVLRSKQQLKEAGLGRVVAVGGAERGGPPAPGGGRLELGVPAGTRRVAVHVSLEGAADGACVAAPARELSATSKVPVMFCVQTTQLCDSIVPDPAQARNFILRNPVHEAVQHTPCFSAHDINTVRAEFTHSGANHSEGGWPEYVNIHDPEATQRYRRKLEKDDAYIHCIMKLTPDLEHYVYQNNAIDMYQTYYTELKQYPKLEESDCRTVNVYRDKVSHGGRRSVSSICWQPEGGYRFAVSYVDVDSNRNSASPLEAYIWDVEQSTSPEATLEPPCPMLDLQYNPREPNVLAGALLSGQVAAWDRRSSASHVLQCPPHVAHRDAVRRVLFINAKSGAELFSGGVDGAVKWWDLRYFTEPTEELILDLVKSNETPSLSNAMGVSSLEFENTIPTRFMVGTEVGMVVTGNRKGKTFAEKLPGKFDAHLGPVWRVERNPGFLKNFLTVGDWTARVWSEECRESAILWTAPDRYSITDGAWSPTRVSLLVLSKGDGRLEAWDLLAAQQRPVLHKQVCREPLRAVRPHEGGALLCCGSATGDAYLLELSQDLVQCDKNDKQLLTSVLERESKRERILEARLREIRLKLRQAEEASPAASLGSLEAAMAGDADLNLATAEFMSIVKKELTYM